MLAEPNCHKRKCRHFQGVRWLGDEETSEVVYCDAFPEGIPGEIAYGDETHLTAYDGDHGLRYEKEDSA